MDSPVERLSTRQLLFSNTCADKPLGKAAPARAGGRKNQIILFGGLPRPEYLLFWAGNSICHESSVVWATTRGKGFFVNWTNARPARLVAKRTSPAISGAPAFTLHRPWPSR